MLFFTPFVFLSANAEPIFIDPQYEVEEFVTGLDWPTTMTFVENDILILQKNDGKVVLIRDRKIANNPILDLEVNHFRVLFL